MRIEITEDARQRLMRFMNEKKARFQLVYDAEGCGCAVSGVPALWLIDPQADSDLVNASDDELPIYYEKRHAVFFEPEMKLSYNGAQNGYKLSSDNQIYHFAMTVMDRRQRSKM